MGGIEEWARGAWRHAHVRRAAFALGLAANLALIAFVLVYTSTAPVTARRLSHHHAAVVTEADRPD